MTFSFMTSFVDCVFCSLGAFILLFVINDTAKTQQVAELQNAAKEHASDMANVRGENERLINDVGAANAKAKESEQAVDEAKKRLADANARERGYKSRITQLIADVNDQMLLANQALAMANAAMKPQHVDAHELFGLEGAMGNVVFALDTSGSMGTNEFPEHKALLQAWIKRLNFERFSLISFANGATLWQPGWTEASTEMRAAAAAHIETFAAAGNTATQHALQLALSLPDVDTVILFSDGAPTDSSADDILQWLRVTNSGRKVAVNTIAIGEYMSSYGKFLKSIARENGGTFLGI